MVQMSAASMRAWQSSTRVSNLLILGVVLAFGVMVVIFVRMADEVAYLRAWQKAERSSHVDDDGNLVVAVARIEPSVRGSLNQWVKEKFNKTATCSWTENGVCCQTFVQI
jgi:hypothetical protein